MKEAWEGTLETGDPEFDLEHVYLVTLIKRIDEAITDGKGPGPVASLLTNLLEEAETHFLSEELLMRERKTPGLEDHSAEHARLIEQLAGLNSQLAAGLVQPAPGLLETIRTWFADHIQGLDRAAARRR